MIHQYSVQEVQLLHIYTHIHCTHTRRHISIYTQTYSVIGKFVSIRYQQKGQSS